MKIFKYIVATTSELPIRPVILMAGDEQQLQPIEKIGDKVQSTETVMCKPELSRITNKITFNRTAQKR